EIGRRPPMTVHQGRHARKVSPATGSVTCGVPAPSPVPPTSTVQSVSNFKHVALVYGAAFRRPDNFYGAYGLFEISPPVTPFNFSKPNWNSVFFFHPFTETAAKLAHGEFKSIEFKGITFYPVEIRNPATGRWEIGIGGALNILLAKVPAVVFLNFQT